MTISTIHMTALALAMAATALFGTGCGGRETGGNPAPATAVPHLAVSKEPKKRIKRETAPKPVDINAIEEVFVEGGTFDRTYNHITSGSFYISKYECTQGLWRKVMGNNPSEFTGNDSLPVENVSYNDVQEFILKLNAKTGKTYRLPSSDEWEYAARGGTKSMEYVYSGSDDVDEVAWCFGFETHPVGAKAPNELGIYDMSGNVHEWTNTEIVINKYDFRMVAGGSHMVAGGSHDADFCRVSSRVFRKSDYRGNNVGFRLILDAADKPAGIHNIDMVFVEGGTFAKKEDRNITVRDFYMLKYEVTQGLWREVMGSFPSNREGESVSPEYGIGDNYPVYYVSWDDVQGFIRKLNAMTGKKYRLPADAEWEYAARGGNRSRGYVYSGGNNIDDVAWYGYDSSDFDSKSGWKKFGGNSNGKVHPVGAKRANELGIHDMSGNVSEWTNDPHVPPKKATPIWPLDLDCCVTPFPIPEIQISYYITRGGSWYFDTKDCRIPSREIEDQDGRYPHMGFRLARDQ